MILINVTVCTITSLAGHYIECTGGAISTECGNLTLINNILYNNSPKVLTETIPGGAINFDKGNLILINNTLYNNTATNGSIMHLDGFWYNSGNISLYNNILYNNTLYNNTAIIGNGVIYCDMTNLTLFNNSLYNNHAITLVVVGKDSSLVISNSTFVNNTRGDDILFINYNNISNFTCYDNVYGGNMLNCSFDENISSLITKYYCFMNATLNLRNIYNDAVRIGNVTVVDDYKYYNGTFDVVNGGVNMCIFTTYFHWSLFNVNFNYSSGRYNLTYFISTAGLNNVTIAYNCITNPTYIVVN